MGRLVCTCVSVSVGDGFYMETNISHIAVTTLIDAMTQALYCFLYLMISLANTKGHFFVYINNFNFMLYKALFFN